jgi:hypothetical protein
LPAGFQVIVESDQFLVLTVISGVLYTGFGDTVSDRSAARLDAGSTWTVPEKTRYFLWAKDGEVVFQQLGVARTARESRQHIQGA